MEIFTWTINDAAGMRRAIRLKVNGIITNRPDVLRQVIANPNGARTRDRLDSAAHLPGELGGGAFARIKQDQNFGHACKSPRSCKTHPCAALLLWE